MKSIDKSAFKKIGGFGSRRGYDTLKVCTGPCGDTLGLKDPEGFHPGFDTIVRPKQ